MVRMSAAGLSCTWPTSFMPPPDLRTQLDDHPSPHGWCFLFFFVFFNPKSFHIPPHKHTHTHYPSLGATEAPQVTQRH